MSRQRFGGGRGIADERIRRIGQSHVAGVLPSPLFHSNRHREIRAERFVELRFGEVEGRLGSRLGFRAAMRRDASRATIR